MVLFGLLWQMIDTAGRLDGSYGGSWHFIQLEPVHMKFYVVLHTPGW